MTDLETTGPGNADPTEVEVGVAVGPGLPPVEEAAPELTETQLEALLFVAERPLSRREIATASGVDRATVDARLGDLEVSLAGRGIRLVVDGDRVELATAPSAGALIARYVGADAIRLTPAALETLAIVAYRQPVTKAAVERIRGVDFGLFDPGPAPSSARRRAGSFRSAGPAVPVRDEPRLPRTVRAHEPRRAAAARLGCRGSARRGGRRGGRTGRGCGRGSDEAAGEATSEAGEATSDGEASDLG